MECTMSCLGAHPAKGEEVVTMSLRLHEVDVDVARLSAAPAKQKERMSLR